MMHIALLSSGIESGLRTILVLTGVTSHEQVERFLALGHVERQQGRLDQALEAYIMAHRLYQSLQQVQGLGHVALALGHIELQRAHLELAEVDLRQNRVDQALLEAQAAPNPADDRRWSYLL